MAAKKKNAETVDAASPSVVAGYFSGSDPIKKK